MDVFKRDKTGYEQWLTAHPDGFVLNGRTMHRASCDHVGPGEDDPSRTEKRCSTKRSELVGWARERYQEAPMSCYSCSP